MDNNNYEKGSKIMSRLTGEQGKRALEEVQSFSPDFAKLIVESFGEIYTRPILDLKQRELLTLSSLITQGASENQLQFHFNAALNIGYTLEEVIEIIIHCSAYAGFPRALNALQILQKVSNKNKESVI